MFAHYWCLIACLILASHCHTYKDTGLDTMHFSSFRQIFAEIRQHSFVNRSRAAQRVVLDVTHLRSLDMRAALVVDCFIFFHPRRLFFFLTCLNVR